MSKIIPKSKNGKKLYKTSWNRIREGVVIISRTRIQTWKAMLIVCFFVGFASALILAVSNDWFGKIFGQEQQISNVAQVVYEDGQGKQYGPVISKEVVTIITDQTCADGTQYNQCSNNKPKYCQNGALIDNCSVCGCPEKQMCQADGSCEETEPIKIKVELEGKANFTSSLHLYIFTPGTDNIVFQCQSTSGNAGKAEIETTPNTLPAGIYDFKIVVPHHLNKKISNITWPSEVEIEFDDVLAGNLQDEDDEINSLDWVMMSQNWGVKYLEDNRPEVDINQDGVVNTIDWSLMNKNWGLRGN